MSSEIKELRSFQLLTSLTTVVQPEYFNLESEVEALN